VKARIHVTLKPGILDPQGQALMHALEMLGFQGVAEARVGKFIELTFEGVPPSRAQALAAAACQKLLANPVMEDFQVALDAD